MHSKLAPNELKMIITMFEHVEKLNIFNAILIAWFWLFNNKLADIELAPHQLFSFRFALRPFSHKSN